MSHASGKDYDPSAWARQRQERIQRATQLRQKRQSGSPDKNHTFKPQLQANLDGAVSKLPLGAKVSDAAGIRRGTYDLTKLDTMTAFAPSVTANGGNNRTFGYSDGSNGSNGKRDYCDNNDNSDGSRGVGEHRDSLDRLEVTTTDRRRLSRVGITGSTKVAAGHGSPRPPPPPPLSNPPAGKQNDSASGYHDNGYANGYANGYTDYSDTYRHRRQREQSLGIENNDENGQRSREYGPATGTGGDALSQEVEQRPTVRGYLSEATPTLPRRGLPESREGTKSTSYSNRPDGSDNEHQVGRSHSHDNDPLEESNERDEFSASLRGEEREGGVVPRKFGRGVRGRGGGGRQAAGKAEWNSDITTGASLGDPLILNIREDSPGAVQSRIDSRLNMTFNNLAHGSPYAALTGSISDNTTHDNKNNQENNNTCSVSSNNVNNGWKHKHTKAGTLLWDAENAEGDVPDAAAVRHRVEGIGAKGRMGCSDDGDGGGDADVGKPSQGYRMQMKPSPASGSLALYNYRDGNHGHGMDDIQGETAELPAEKEQLRRNLSLLKKKIDSQARRRRSQSAGPRAGELHDHGDDERSSGANPDPRHDLHMTTGTAPAMMSTAMMSTANKPGVLAGRDRGLAQGGRKVVGARVRPAPEGPGSPYAIDPRSTGPRCSRKDHAGHDVSNGYRESNGHVESNVKGGPSCRHNESNRYTERRRATIQPSGQNLSGNSASNEENNQDYRSNQHEQRFHRRGGPTRNTSGSGSAPTDTVDFANVSTRGKLGGVEFMERSAADSMIGTNNHSGKVQSPDWRRGWGRDSGDVRRGAGRTSNNNNVRNSRGVGSGGGNVNTGGSREKFGGYADDLPADAFPEEEVELVECRECARKFTAEALMRHAKACQTVFRAKRKVFNAAEMRLKGTELERFATITGRGGKASGGGRQGKGRTTPPNPSRRFDDTPVGAGGGRAKSSKWRQQSSQFRAAIRQARLVTDTHKSGKSLADFSPPKPSEPDPSLVPCPHCGRRFNEAAGERHMLHCNNIKAKPSVLKKGSGSLLGHAARASSGKGSRGHRW